MKVPLRGSRDRWTPTKGLGENHPSSLNAMSSMAMALYRQGLYEESIEWNRTALRGKEKLRGDEHPWTLITVLDISTVLPEQGLYDEALSGHRRASKVYENLGKDHPLTITTVHDMAMVLSGKDVTRIHRNGAREHQRERKSPSARIIPRL